MPRHKLSLDINYVSDWDAQAAIRELFQNAIDPGNWTYRINQDKLTIISHNAELPKATLLLGHSVKASGSIGKFGEGYKLAMLVLTRLGYKCKIYTPTEVWIPKLINSRTYGTKQLVFDTEPNTCEYDQSLAFEVIGLTQDDIGLLYERNLHLDPKIAWQSTSKGIILNDRPGQIFIGGLYVATLEDFKYGYNFKSEVISLDRDRRIVRDFDVAWLTAQMWKETTEYDIVNKLIIEKAPDIKDLTYFQYNLEAGFADTAANAFIVEYGKDALPVASQTELAKAQEENYTKIVLVEPVQKDLIIRSDMYITPPPPRPIKTPREELMEFKIEYWPQMSEELCDALNVLIEKAESWRKV